VCDTEHQQIIKSGLEKEARIGNLPSRGEGWVFSCLSSYI